MEVLDPTHGDDPVDFLPATRPGDLDGATVGVVSNGKQGTVAFFEAFEAELRNHYGVREVVRVTKDNYSAPADAAVMDRAARWTALVAGVGD